MDIILDDNDSDYGITYEWVPDDGDTMTRVKITNYGNGKIRKSISLKRLSKKEYFKRMLKDDI